jgi:hypothetical protein
MAAKLSFMYFSAILLLTSPLAAQHDVPYEVVSGGGGVLYGDHTVYCTVGQAMAQSAVICPTHRCQSGFWYLAALESTVEVAITAFACDYRDDAVHLSWSFSASARFQGTSIFRAEGDEEFQEITPEPLSAGVGTYVDEDVLPGRSYRYYILALDTEGSYPSQTLTVNLPPKPLTLYQNYPNPFNPSTSIVFFLPEQCRVTIVIFDVQGRRVRTLVDDARNAGRHVLFWDGRNDAGKSVGSGIYYCRLSAGKNVQTKKLAILR